MTNKTVLLFSYGTLQSSTVQLETFGRELVGYKDKLLNYRLAMLLLGQGLKKSPIGQKLDFANHPYLCKGLYYAI
jgi:hypothetical protein